MRISDWSSDVCSSDLVARYSRFINSLRASIICRCFLKLDPVFPRAAPIWLLESGSFQGVIMAKIKLTKTAVEAAQPQTKDVELRDTRSEEHTSELQSLMRISYAVFCLKKKT